MIKEIKDKKYLAKLIEQGEHEHQDFKYQISDAKNAPVRAHIGKINVNLAFQRINQILFFFRLSFHTYIFTQNICFSR